MSEGVGRAANAFCDVGGCDWCQFVAVVVGRQRFGRGSVVLSMVQYEANCRAGWAAEQVVGAAVGHDLIFSAVLLPGEFVATGCGGCD